MSPEMTSGESSWIEVLATVITCEYDAGVGRALAFGIPTTKHFRITYNYFADDELHTGEFMSAKAIPQGTLFPIRYNPDVVGISGSLVLSILWFAVMRGCH
jgi:hypothetical protein